MNLFGANTPERRVERLIARGERLFEHGREHEGLQKLTEAANVLPEASKPSLHLGRAYVKLHDYQRALKCYYKGLYFCELADEPSILCEIAQIYLTMRRYDLAEDKLKKVLQLEFPLSPSLLETMTTMARKGLINIYLRTGRFSDAIAQQQSLLDRAPEDVQIIRALAESYRHLGQNRKARILLQRAIELAQYAGEDGLRKQLERKLQAVSFPDGTEYGLKEQLYAEQGSICLGTAGDDGIELVARQADVPLTLDEICVTLSRLVAVTLAFSWNLTCLVPVDKPSGPIAAIIGSLLELPVKTPATVAEQDAVLVCQMHFQSQQPMTTLLRTITKQTAAVISFALLAAVRRRDMGWAPDVIGIPIEEVWHAPRQSWLSRLLFRPQLSPVVPLETEIVQTEHGRQQVVENVWHLPEEPTLTRQIAYYRHDKPHLRPQLTATTEEADWSAHDRIPQLLSQKRLTVCMALHHLRPDDLRDSSVSAFLKTLYVENRNAAVRRMIGQHLLQMDNEEGLTYLVNLFTHPDTDVLLRLSILETLGASSSRRVSPVIALALQAPHDALRIRAVQYLSKLDQAANLTPVLEHLLNDLPDILGPTLHYLRTSGTPGTNTLLPQYLLGLLGHTDPAVVHEALDLLRAQPDIAGTPEVLALLTHPDSGLVEHAISTLGFIGDLDCSEHLLPFLDDARPELRYAATASLLRLDHQRSLVFLMERLQKETPGVQAQLLRLLGKIGSAETAAFIVRFAEQHKAEPAITAAAVGTLARFQHSQSLEFVRNTAKTCRDNEQILHAYLTLANTYGDETDTEFIVTFVESPPPIRFRAAAYLYTHTLKRYFHILQDGIRSSRVSMNLLALDVLADIGDALSFQTICSAFQRQDPRLDRHIAAVLRQHQPDLTMVGSLASSERDMLWEGIQRAIQASQTVTEALNNMECLAMFWPAEARQAIRHVCDHRAKSVLVCGALQWFAHHEPELAQKLSRALQGSDNIEVANAAYRLVSIEERLHAAGHSLASIP